ncbi:MAG: potassium-transporting ATPase subunit KdpC [Myxococcales bacterium]|nr:potassium-transporting ATPase subunit KdpC [Myxococcales bacterium]
MRTLRPALSLLALFTLVCGVVYPLAVTAAARLAWPRQAAGSVVRVDGRAVGSTLVGQAFTDPGYLWGRPSATGYDAHTSSGTNLGPRDPRLVAALTERAAALAATAPGRPVPIELITASASGLDPHVSPAAARFQIARIAAARGVTPAEVAAIVDAAVEPPTLGVLGASRVNVLAVNLALDRRLGRPRAVQ